HPVRRTDTQRRSSGPSPGPVAAQRQDGVGQVVTAGDGVEHRRHLVRLLLQRRPAHDADATCESERPGIRTASGRLIQNMSGKVWFITGTSRGFGREWTIAALERGDRVAATARDISTLNDLADRYGD